MPASRVVISVASSAVAAERLSNLVQGGIWDQFVPTKARTTCTSRLISTVHVTQ